MGTRELILTQKVEISGTHRAWYLPRE